MGQNMSKNGLEMPEFNGVRMTHRLGRKLGLVGREREFGIGSAESIPQQKHELLSARISTAKLDDDIRKETMKLVEKNNVLSKALERSKEVNRLLLVREEEELKKIEKLASDILEEENAEMELLPEHPGHAVPCGEYKRHVLECYNRNVGAEYRCRTVVDEYSACSRRLVQVE